MTIYISDPFRALWVRKSVGEIFQKLRVVHLESSVCDDLSKNWDLFGMVIFRKKRGSANKGCKRDLNLGMKKYPRSRKTSK